MKILVLSSSFPRFEGDYFGVMVYNFISEMSDSKIEFGVIAPHFPGSELSRKIHEKHTLWRFRYFFPESFQKVAYGEGIPTNLKKSFVSRIQIPFFLCSFLCKALLKSRKYSIIHSQWIYTGLIGMITAKIRSVKSVLTVRRFVFNTSISRLLAKIILKNHDFIIFNSSYTRNRVLEVLPLQNYAVIPSTVDVDKFHPEVSGIVRIKYHLLITSKIIMTAGMLVEKKGIKYLIEAFQKVSEKMDTYLVIIGTGYLQHELQNLTEQLRISKRVIFCGRIDHNDMPHYLKDADVFVLPSIVDSGGETETLGMVLVEAMACGVPVIGSRVGGVVDIISPQTGYFVPPKDSDALCHAILELLQDEEKRIVMSKEARKVAIEKFSVCAVKRKYLTIYSQLINI